MSFDQLICEREHRRRQLQAERLAEMTTSLEHVVGKRNQLIWNLKAQRISG
jgi:hypothetical protein